MNEEDKGGSKFTKDGSVVRITMKNFMTYKHETIWPGWYKKNNKLSSRNGRYRSRTVPYGNKSICGG